MKGFAYLDVDGNLYCKSYDYITTENPYFWKDNNHLVVIKWQFDTNQLSSMRAMLTQFKSLQLKQHLVDAFLEGINFDISTLKRNANNIQSR
jgi:hypothetical protein